MRPVRILFVWGAVGDVAVHDDQGRPVVRLVERAESALEHLQVVGVPDTRHIPAIGDETRGHVFAERPCSVSLAGHLQLNNLCWIYDNNRITIEGHTAWAFSEDVATRFIAYGWNVTRVGDANDLEMLERAFRTFHKANDRPTLIIVDSHIAYGSPNKQDTHGAHGEPLGEEEIRLTKRNYAWPEDAKFLVPERVREHFRAGIGERGKRLRGEWMAKFEQYRKTYPELADHLYKMQHRELPAGWDKDLPSFPADPKGVAGRDASGTGVKSLAKSLPRRVGGGGAPAPSPKTQLSFVAAGGFIAEKNTGPQIHFCFPQHPPGAIF